MRPDLTGHCQQQDPCEGKEEGDHKARFLHLMKTNEFPVPPLSLFLSPERSAWNSLVKKIVCCLHSPISSLGRLPIGVGFFQ